MSNRRHGLVLVTLAVTVAAAPAPAAGQGTPTRIMVRVLAHDAKLIGSAVGGARVTVRELGTGKVLAQGVQAGGTGSTERIMVDPQVRHRPLFDAPGAAGFLATLSLAEPTPIEVVAEGPLGTDHAMQRATKTLLAVPGRDVLGDGVVLELMGFTVQLEAPSDSTLPPAAGRPFTVLANVTMLCGCPTEPGGLWDALAIEVVATLRQGDSVVAWTRLAYAGRTSTYHAGLLAPAPGAYTLEVMALDPPRGNFGRVIRPVRVTP